MRIPLKHIPARVHLGTRNMSQKLIAQPLFFAPRLFVCNDFHRFLDPSSYPRAMAS